MINRLREKYLLFVRSLELTDLVENFIIVAVTTIIVVRFYLNISGYPQVGVGGLHVAHMLWGGLLLCLALIMSLAFLNKEARHISSLIGGIGFGLFIDEIGKFVTQDNNYFFHPTFALIYIIFVLLFLLLRTIMRIFPFSDKEYAINALEVMKELVFYDLDEDERQKALDYLHKSNPNDPLVKTMIASLEKIKIEQSDEDVSVITLFKRRTQDFFRRVLETPRAAKMIVTSFVILSVIRFLFAVRGIEWEWNFWEWGRDVSLILVFVITSIGLYWHRKKKMLLTFESYKRASIISILIVQIFDFYHDQLSAMFYLIVNLVIYMALNYLISEQRR